MIDLVGGHVQETLHTRDQPDTLQDVHRAHHVGFVSVCRVLIAVPNNGLGRQMEDDLRLCRPECRHQLFPVPDVPDHRGHPAIQARQLKQVGLGGRFQRVAGDNRPGIHQDAAQPRALKAGVAGDKDPLAAVEFHI